MDKDWVLPMSIAIFVLVLIFSVATLDQLRQIKATGVRVLEIAEKFNKEP